MKKFFHQSYVLVALCLGVVSGMALMQVLHWNFFASPLWILFALVLLIYAFCYPNHTFIILAFLSGVIIAAKKYTDETNNLTSADFILAFRDNYKTQIDLNIGSPEAKLGIAYLLGIKDGLPETLSQNLRAIGLAHIVVASGTHLSILIDVTRKVFGRISRRVGLVSTLILIILFMSLIGFTPSILRAGIVAILSLIAWYVGRKFESWRIILLAATITLLINPGFLENLGWQMSFASFAGVMVLAPKIQRFCYGKAKPPFVGSVIITTVAATLATLPITLYHFGSFSLLAIAANLLILPTLPFAMGLTFGAGLPLVGPIFAFFAKGLLHLHILIVDFFATQSYFTVKIPPHNAWVFLLYPLILVPLIIRWHKKRRRYIIKA